MNILLRHTLASIARNPVQSVIIMISTAMITACILVCLCISSMFEYTTSLWANKYYVGSQMVIYAGADTRETVLAWIEEHSDEIEAYTVLSEIDAIVIVDDETINAKRLGVEYGTLDEFDEQVGAMVLSYAENTTEFPSAHISLSLARTAGLDVGDLFDIKNSGTFFVEAICADTSCYYPNPELTFSCEIDLEAATTGIRFNVWFNDPYALNADGKENTAAYADEVGALIKDRSAVVVSARDSFADAAESVGESMRMMNIAAAVITVVMVCLLCSSFSVIVRSRVGELVKFKAAGATPAQSVFILLSEAAVYVIVGGLIGLALGQGLVGYLNGLVAENVTSAVITPGATDYVLALFIGAACGLAACFIPAVRMSVRPIHRLLGGTERIKKHLPLPVALVITAAALAVAIAVFTVPTSALLPVSFAAVALLLVWLLTVMPSVLRALCFVARKFTRSGAELVAEYAAPRNASVNSVFTMLAALIAFIWLGTCLIDIVTLTGSSSSARYDSDFVVKVDNLSPATYEQELERCLAVDGITSGALIGEHNNVILAYPDGTPVGETSIDASIRMLTVQTGAALDFCCLEPIGEDVIERFDKAVADGSRPIVLTRYLADQYGFSIGDEVMLLATTYLGYGPVGSTFTVVGIDDSVTAWDYYAMIYAGDMDYESVPLTPIYTIYLNGDESAFAQIRDEIDTEWTTLFRNSGYFPLETSGALDTQQLLSVFSLIIYTVAAVGLINLIVITASERKKEFDVFRLAGMTFSDALRYILAETALLAVGGFSVGLLFALLAEGASRGIAQVVDKFLSPAQFSPESAVIAAAATGIYVLLWIVSHIIAFAQVSTARYRRREDRMLRSD